MTPTPQSPTAPPSGASPAGVVEYALEDPAEAVAIPTNTPVVLAAETRYARATAVAVEGHIAPGERVTLRATAGTAWQMVPVTDSAGHVQKDNRGRPLLKQGKVRPATPAELRQLRWRVHSGGDLLVDQRPGTLGDAVTLTLPARLLGETVVAGAYNYEPTVNVLQHWWVEDPREPGGRRGGRGEVAQDVLAFAATMGRPARRASDVDPQVAAVYEAFAARAAHYGVATTLQQAHFLAQVRHETLGLRALTELIDPSAAGRKYARSNGNLGAEDGRAFIGRGLLQTTGYSGYRALFRAVRDDDVERGSTPPEVAHARLRAKAPAVAADLALATEAGLYFWKTKPCDARAAVDDALGVSIRVNGWLTPTAGVHYLPNHYDERVRMLREIKAILGLVR